MLEIYDPNPWQFVLTEYHTARAVRSDGGFLLGGRAFPMPDSATGLWSQDEGWIAQSWNHAAG